MPQDDIRNINLRRRNILFLVERYLQDNAYYGTAEALKTEARLSDEYEVCDNIDLDAVYLDYASYYQLKFGKFPRVLRPRKDTAKMDVKAQRLRKPKGHSTRSIEPPSEPKNDGENCETDLQIMVTPLNIGKEDEMQEDNKQLTMLQELDHGNNQEMFCGPEWMALADLIRSIILRDDLKLSWADMCGNVTIIDMVKEAVVAPIKHPALFAKNVKPWRSALIHGPPGTGKTLLAKILYCETRERVTFFNVTSSVIVSKWRGESEKLIRVLFRMAQSYAPSIIFFDEIEGLTSHRDRLTDHEASRRFKNELLQLLDGMEQRPSGVFVLATSNMPWEIDVAFLRRFEKKMLVQLPNKNERMQLIIKLLPNSMELNESKVVDMVEWSEHFNGDEIRLACKELTMQMLRMNIHGGGGGGGGKTNTMADLDIKAAFKRSKPLCMQLMAKHVQWQQENGS